MMNPHPTGKAAPDGALVDLLLAHGLEEVVYAKLGPVVSGLTSNQPGLYREIVSQVERALFRLALQHTAGNQRRAAALIGLSRNTLRARLVALGLPPDEIE